MNIDRKKYLSDVFRKEIKFNLDESASSTKERPVSSQDDLNTSNFLIDTKFKLRLDEIV
jgi:hypothetical protein